jgi:excisionase family DNA binding protein
MSGRIFHGAQEIADYLQLTRRAVYHLIKSGRLPVFRLGTAKIHARQEVLDRFIEEQEQRNSSCAANSNKSAHKKSAA